MRSGYVFLLGLVVAACGGSSGSGEPDAPLHDAHHVDSPPVDHGGFLDTPISDAALPDGALPDGGFLSDATTSDGTVVVHDAGSDGGIIIVDGGQPDTAFPTSCDVLTQTGCIAGEKCTWVTDAAGNGSQACTANGAVAVGGACSFSNGNPSYDNCTAGNYCISGSCEPICNANTAAAPMCDVNHACQDYSGLFTDTSGSFFAGVCDVRCDPLTQVSYPTLAACNSPMPATPNHTCVSGNFSDWTCAPTSATALGLEDRAVITGVPYLNACAPGFMPLLYSDSNATAVICSGLCSPLDTDNTHTANAPGDATIAAKLPLQAAPMVGNATCAIGKKGSETSEECRFIWPLDFDATGNLNVSPYNNTLGYCFAPEHYMYDSDNNGTLDTVQPYCATLSMADAITFGCYTSSESGYPAHHPAPSTLSHGMRLPHPAATLKRHVFAN